jgi:hypothetical protein
MSGHPNVEDVIGDNQPLTPILPDVQSNFKQVMSSMT